MIIMGYFFQFSIKTYNLILKEYPHNIFFYFFLHKNICCGYSLEVPQQCASNEYPHHMFLWRNKKNYPRIITKYSLTSPDCGSSLETSLLTTLAEMNYLKNIILSRVQYSIAPVKVIV